jgi:hypothetical protein
MTWRRLHSTERSALVIFAVLFLSTFVEAWLYRKLWIGSLVVLLFVWMVALMIAVLKVGDALRDDDLDGRRRIRVLASVPSAILIVLVSKFGLQLGPRTEASLYLMWHSDELRQAEIKAGSGQAAAIPYLSRIPDGGTSIIHSNVPPYQLSSAEQLRLTNEHITGCLRLIHDAWICDHD